MRKHVLGWLCPPDYRPLVILLWRKTGVWYPCPGLRLWDREGESQPEPSLHPAPPPSNGLSPHGCPSGPGHRCVAGHGAPGAVCRRVPAAWPGYSGCSPGPGPRGTEKIGHQRHRASETHSAPAAGRHGRGLPGSPTGKRHGAIAQPSPPSTAPKACA